MQERKSLSTVKIIVEIGQREKQRDENERTNKIMTSFFERYGKSMSVQFQFQM